MRKVCTYCGQEGHRAHRCPNRQHASRDGVDGPPMTARDLFWATLLVAIVAAVSRLGLEFAHA